MTCNCNNQPVSRRCACSRGDTSTPNRKGVVGFCDICNPCEENVSNVKLCAFVVPTLEEGRYFKNSFVFVQEDDSVYFITEERSEIPFGSRPKFIDDFDPGLPENNVKRSVVYDMKNGAAYVFGEDGNYLTIPISTNPVSSLTAGDGIVITAVGGNYTIAVDGDEIASKEQVDSISDTVDAHSEHLNDVDTDITTLATGVASLETSVGTLSTAVANKQDTLTAGENITIVNNVISATGGGQGTTDYEELDNLPSIEGQTLIGNMTLSELGIQEAGSYVTDPYYVHTDANFTVIEKGKLAGLSNYDDTNVWDSIDGLSETVTNIASVIPEQATESNLLADRAFVNSTVQTNAANFRGNWETWTAVPTTTSAYPADHTGETTPSLNDYLVVQDASGYQGQTLTGTWRFKYTGVWATVGKAGWIPEYQVNGSSMTAAQLAALNSGATTTLIGQITTNSQAITSLQTSKQNTLTAGTNVTIQGTTISATDTTYNNFVGATSTTTGAAGLVPAPTSSDGNKFLKGDGTWGETDGRFITMTTTDPGEGATLAANHFIAVYEV